MFFICKIYFYRQIDYLLLYTGIFLSYECFDQSPKGFFSKGWKPVYEFLQEPDHTGFGLSGLNFIQILNTVENDGMALERIINN